LSIAGGTFRRVGGRGALCHRGAGYVSYPRSMGSAVWPQALGSSSSLVGEAAFRAVDDFAVAHSGLLSRASTARSVVGPAPEGAEPAPRPVVIRRPRSSAAESCAVHGFELLRPHHALRSRCLLSPRRVKASRRVGAGAVGRAARRGGRSTERRLRRSQTLRARTRAARRRARVCAGARSRSLLRISAARRPRPGRRSAALRSKRHIRVPPTRH
jgi:hypothetical protein